MKPQPNAKCSFELGARHVDVWSVQIQCSRAVAAKFEGLLARDEMQRARRFRFEHLYQFFVISRGVLRILLGRYLGVSAGSIEFNYSARGKPVLAAPIGLQFNASHSGQLSVFAFTAGCEVGIDAEQIRQFHGLEDVATRFFASEEVAELLSLGADERVHAFFRCWTRKEAYVKAIGEGLSASLNNFRVSLRPREPARLIHVAHDQGAAKHWTLNNLQPVSGYAAAVAYHDTERWLTTLPLVNAVDLR
jgi:4'-phosphopantetheinyl transferase